MIVNLGKPSFGFVCLLWLYLEQLSTMEAHLLMYFEAAPQSTAFLSAIKIKIQSSHHVVWDGVGFCDPEKNVF